MPVRLLVKSLEQILTIKNKNVRSRWMYGKDIEGSHVQLANSENKEIYIVPLCSVHRSGTEILSIIDSCKLVSSDIGKTCGVEGSKYLKDDEL